MNTSPSGTSATAGPESASKTAPARGIIARRASAFDSSGIRRAFDLAASLENPINLSIGQPDFVMPPEAPRGAIA
ncbi:MAG: hypothetical protein ACO3NZ_03355, partial [Pirellulales bacterium]